jgi:hypothetical protein
VICQKFQKIYRGPSRPAPEDEKSPLGPHQLGKDSLAHGEAYDPSRD